MLACHPLCKAGPLPLSSMASWCYGVCCQRRKSRPPSEGGGGSAPQPPEGGELHVFVCERERLYECLKTSDATLVGRCVQKEVDIGESLVVKQPM